MRFTLRQLLAGVALVAVVLTVFAVMPRSMQSRRTFTLIRSLAFSPDGSKLAVVHFGARDAGVRMKLYMADICTSVIVIDSANLSNKLLVQREFFEGNQGPALGRRGGAALAFSPDLKNLYFSDWSSRGIRAWNFNNQEWTVPVRSAKEFAAYSLSPNGRHFSVSDQVNGDKFLDIQTKQTSTSLANSGWQHLSTDGRRMARVSRNSVQIWDIEKNELIRTFHDGKDTLDHVTSIALSASGETVAVRCNEGLRLYDIATGNEQVLLPEYFEIRRSAKGWGTSSRGPRTFGVAFSIDGKLLAAWGEYGLKFYDMSDDAKLPKQVTDQRFSQLVFSPDGKTFATGDGKGRIAIWDIATQQEIRSTVLAYTEK
jgi:WD40 repeat protein